MQHRHLREHAITCLVNDDAARSVEDGLADNDAATYRQAVHKTAVILRVVEPGFVDAPVDVFFPDDDYVTVTEKVAEQIIGQDDVYHQVLEGIDIYRTV